tara:strand:- start:944 stop:2167 length:1224 start_codon:yes stop_codon:yes gene_type:complete
MANNFKPIPKSQKILSKKQIEKKATGQKPISLDPKRRELQRSVKNDDTKRLHIGLRDIDETIVFYFNNVIKPSVIQNGSRKNVPIIYGSPERWKSVQKDGFYRDKNGKIQAPLIMFKRDSVEKNRALGNKVDPNNPLTYGVFKKKFSKKNVYDRFSVLTNRSKIDELYGVIIPDYVTLTYSCIIFTDYIEQMNKIIEAVNYASDSYWGDVDKFNFRAKIDSYTTTTELSQGQDRAVKTNFTITMYGYIVPDTIQAQISGMNKYYSKSAVKFQLETAGTLEELTAKAGTSQADTTVRFIDKDGGGQPPISSLTTAEIAYLNTNNTFIANSISNNQATFSNAQFVSAPTGFSAGVERHMVYINGTFVPTQHYTISQSGNNLIVTIDPTSTFFGIDSGDQIILTGKVQTV